MKTIICMECGKEESEPGISSRLCAGCQDKYRVLAEETDARNARYEAQDAFNEMVGMSGENEVFGKAFRHHKNYEQDCIEHGFIAGYLKARNIHKNTL